MGRNRKSTNKCVDHTLREKNIILEKYGIDINDLRTLADIIKDKKEKENV